MIKTWNCTKRKIVKACFMKAVFHFEGKHHKVLLKRLNVCYSNWKFIGYCKSSRMKYFFLDFSEIWLFGHFVKIRNLSVDIDLERDIQILKAYTALTISFITLHKVFMFMFHVKFIVTILSLFNLEVPTGLWKWEISKVMI